MLMVAKVQEVGVGLGPRCRLIDILDLGRERMQGDGWASGSRSGVYWDEMVVGGGWSGFEIWQFEGG